MIRAAGAAVFTLLAGCQSTVQWDKPGATRESAEADARACSTLAQSYPTVPRARPTRELLQNVTDRDADRQLQEAQRVDACMRQKGYTLRRT
jgi:hypothetical protein